MKNLNTNTTTFVVTAQLADNKGITSEQLRKATVATEGITGSDRSKATTKEARVQLLINAGVDTIVISEDGTVSVLYVPATPVDEAIKKEAKSIRTEVNGLQDFIRASNSDEVMTAILASINDVLNNDDDESPLLVPTKKDKYGFVTGMKRVINTVGEFFAMLNEYDLNLNTNVSSIMREALIRFGEKSIISAMGALNFYAVTKGNTTSYPYRPIIKNIWDNFCISEKFRMGTRDQILTPFVSVSEKNATPSNVGVFLRMVEQRIELLDAINGGEVSDEDKQSMADEVAKLNTDIENFSFVFYGGTKEDLLSATGGFTASSDSGLTRIRNIEVKTIDLVKEVSYVNPLTKKVEVTEYNVSRRVTYDLVNIQYVGLSEQTTEMLTKLKHNGFSVVGAFGGPSTINVEYLLATVSKQRTLGATYCAVKNNARKFETALSIHEARGTEFLTYASEGFANGKVVYTLKGEQRFKRAGLEAASSILVPTIRFGTEVKYYKTGTWTEITKEEGQAIGVYDYVLTGGTHTMRVVKIEVKSVVKNGEYLAYSKDDVEIKKLDTAWGEDYWQKFISNDGANAYYSDSVRNAILIALGLDVMLLQGRWANSGKGMAMYLPGSEFITTLGDFVVFENNIKGNMEIAAQQGHSLEFAICNYAKNPKLDAEINMPYQMLGGYKDITADDLLAIFKRGVAKLEKALTNLDDALALLGANLDQYNGEVKDLVDAGLSDEEIEGEIADRQFTTVLKEALLKSQGAAFNDGYIKNKLWSFMKKLMRHWLVGAVSVKGEYKFALQDPLAVIDTLYGFWNGEIEGYTEDGEFFVDVPDALGTVRSGQAVVTVLDNNGEVTTYKGDAVFQRNPQYADVEVAYALCVSPTRYSDIIKTGALNNCIVYSHYDFNLIRQGRQDCDGDRSAFITEEYFVTYMRENFKNYPALLDVTVSFDETGKPQFKDGCPYENKITDADVPQIPANLIISQDKFKVKFTAEQYANYELKYWLTQVEIAWALRNLNQNEIGMLTDRTTMIIDTNTLIKECLKVGKNRWGTDFSKLENMASKGVDVSEENRVGFYQSQYSINRLATYKLRYAGGWEIDLPKKGGAYKDALRNSFLDFYFDNTKTTPILSIANNEGKRNVVKPLWFDLNKRCVTTEEIINEYVAFYNPELRQELETEQTIKHRKRVKSVLDQHLSNGYAEYKRLSQLVYNLLKGQNHLAGFLSRISYNTANESEIIDVITKNRAVYATVSTQILAETKAELEAIDNMTKINAKTRSVMKRNVNKARSQKYAELNDLCMLLLKEEAVINNSCPIYVGYLAYELSSKDKGSNGYAWTIAWEYFAQTLEACAAATANVAREWNYKRLGKQDKRGSVVAERISFVVPEQVGISAEDIAKGISYYGKPLQVRRFDSAPDCLYVYAWSGAKNEYMAVGKIVYKNIISLFNGINEAYVNFDANRVIAGGNATVAIFASEIKFK